MRLPLAAIALASLLPAQEAEPVEKPDILFVILDDLNDWIGCMGGHPDAKTPHLDALAESGILFTNAHCAGPACNPSRTALFTGRAPHRTGLYTNRQKMREVLPDEGILPLHMTGQGYRSVGGGKLLHYFVDGPSWDDYFPSKDRENPFPRTLYPKERPVSLPREPWMYVETDWGPLDATLEEFGGDYSVAQWVGRTLRKQQDKPLFLAAGIYRPHEPWFVPKPWFDMFPIDEVDMPIGYREDDLDDLPPQGRRRGPNRYLAHIRKHGQWREGVRAYLASIAFADAMLGRMLDALDESGRADRTIVVVTSDHGWHLGEKEHWQKFTGWRVCTRVPLMVRVPKGVSGAMPDGTSAGSRCDAPVSLLDLFPTFCELAGVEAKSTADGRSLVPLLRDVDAEWPHVAFTSLDGPGSYAVSGPRYRYIHYPDGGEELYDIASDRHEWRNLAGSEESAPILERLRARVPSERVPKRR